MKIRILGSGTSTGVPQIGCECEVCTSQDPRDKRLRASVLIEIDEVRLLVDCGPDFRQQVLGLPFEKIDGVLVTHEHYDHVGGLDDLRPFCCFGAIPVFVEHQVAIKLGQRMPYCFLDKTYPGVPNIFLKQIQPGESFTVRGVEICPIVVMHGALPILGYRIGRLAYITDMLSMPEESYEQLDGIEILIINALRLKAHPTHQTLDDALAVVKRLHPKVTYLMHMSHHMGLHAEIQRRLPDTVFLAYDGLEIEG